MSIFELIGGAEVLVAAIDEFYERVLDDADLAPSFNGVDLDRLKAHQRAFLTVALGGPQIYDGRPLAEAHAGLGITVSQFQMAIDHLVDTFTSMSVEPDIIEDIVVRLSSLESDVVEPQQAVSL